MTSSGSRAAIYARFSTDLQSERSIDDQIALCRAYAEREQLEVVSIYSDRARSGASMFGRDGLLAMLDAAKDRQFDVVIVEALDRLSRDMEDMAGMHKRLAFAGVAIRTVHEGTADAVQVGLRGIVSQLFLADLAHKVRRGMTGVVRDGRHAGGRAYGYRAVPGSPGELVIHEAEAQIVRRIFDEFIAGRSPRDIAGDLNAERVPPPRGAKWNASTINGNASRGHGIILNEVYAGRIVWNRVRMVKDPETGKRVSRLNPQSEWQRADAPRLRIVPDDVWSAAQDRKRVRAHNVGARMDRKRRLLSGLLRCHACDGGMSIKDAQRGRTRIECSTHKESRACSNGTPVDLATVEQIVFATLAEHMKRPVVIEQFIRSYVDEWHRLARSRESARDKLIAREQSLARELDRMVDAIASGAPVAPIKARMNEVDDALRETRAQIASATEAPPAPRIHPATVARYATDFAGALAMLNGEPHQRTREALHKFVAKVIVRPGSPPGVEIIARVSALLEAPLPRIALSKGGSVVAEARCSVTPRIDFPLITLAGTMPVWQDRR